MALMWDRSPNPAIPKQTYRPSKDAEVLADRLQTGETKNIKKSLKMKMSNTLTFPVRSDQRSWQSFQFDFKNVDGSTADENVLRVTDSSTEDVNSFRENAEGGSTVLSNQVPDNPELFARPVLDVGKQANKVSSISDSLEIRQNRENSAISNTTESSDACFIPWNLQNTSQNKKTHSGRKSPKIHNSEPGLVEAHRSQIPKLRPNSSGALIGSLPVPALVVTDMSSVNSVHIVREVTRSPPSGSLPSKRQKRRVVPGGQLKTKTQPPVPKRTSSVKHSSHHS
jgi:hypothetical protein